MGGELSLWDPLLLEWLLWMRHAVPQLALRAEVGLPESLSNQVSEGILDIAVAYAPHHRPGLKVELLIEEKLVLVTTSRRGQAQRATDYVFVDWGPEFAVRAGCDMMKGPMPAAMPAAPTVRINRRRVAAESSF